jgi:hypothetical protein
MDLKPNELDSEVTLLFKKAQSMGILAKYTYTDADGEIKSFADYVAKEIMNLTLDKIYDKALLLKVVINPVELGVMWYYILSKKYEPNPKREEQYMKLINQFYRKVNKDNERNSKFSQLYEYRDVADFQSKTKMLEEYNNRLLLKQESQILKFNYLHNKLFEVEPVKYTEPVINMSILAYYPVFASGTYIGSEGEKPHIEDGIDIFNKMVPSFNVPFIHYNDKNGKSFVWIYEGSEENKDVPQFNLIVQSEAQTKKLNHIFMTVLSVPEDKRNGGSYSNESYVIVSYDLETGHISVPTPVEEGGANRLKDRVQSSLSTLILGSSHETHISATYEIYGVSIDETSLHYFLLNVDVFKAFINIDESDTSIAEKVRNVNIHYNSLGRNLKPRPLDAPMRESVASSLVLYFGNLKEAGATHFVPASLESVVNSETFKEESTKALKINITKADSQEILTTFTRIFSRLLRLYMDDKIKFETYYKQMIRSYVPRNDTSLPGDERDEGDEGEGDDEEEVSSSVKTRAINGKKKNAELRKAFGEIFTEGYARKCSCKFQPILVKEDEVEAWKQTTFIDRDVVKNRSVQAFPPPRFPGEKPLFYVVCPTYLYPYVNPRDNKGSSNSDSYPYVPCCTKTDQKSFATIGYYNKIDAPELIPKSNTASKNGYKILTSKFLAYERETLLPPKLNSVLQRGIGTSFDFYRMGMHNTPSSLLHCVIYALQYQQYLDLKLIPEKQEELIKISRVKGLSKANPLIYKQELFNMSDAEIMQKVLDTNVFLDPYLFFKGVEEVYNVNIFVINLDGQLHPIKGINSEETTPCVEVPKCHTMHIRTPNYDRKTILILKHWGAEDNLNKRPHCELIFARGTSGVTPRCNDCVPVLIKGSVTSNVFSFGKTMAELMHDLLEQSMHFYVFSFPKSSDLLQVRDQPFNNIDWSKIIPFQYITGQRVDKYGKLRVLEITVEGQIATIYVPPSQPLGGISKQRPNGIPYIVNPQKTTEEFAIKLFGQPSGRINSGLWFPIIDYEFGVYCPCHVTDATLMVKEGPIPPVYLEEDKIKNNNIEEIRVVKKCSLIIIQLIKWLWSLGEGFASEENPRGRPTMESWFARYVINDAGMSTKYTLPGVSKRKLPLANTTSEGITALSAQEWWPQYFRADGVHLYPKLYEHCFGFLRRDYILNDGLHPEETAPITHLDGYYVNDDDFEKKNQAVVFTNSSHLKSWISYHRQMKSDRGTIIPIFETLDLSATLYNEPYIFRDKETSKIYMIQNVKDGDINRAYAVAAKWRIQGINSGFETPPEPHAQFPYSISGILVDGNVYPLIDHTQGGTDYFQYLKYNKNDMYAAMLPLL